MPALCVCIGANQGLDTAYLEATQKLGEDLAKNNITLIYGGSNLGLMGVLADTVMEHNGTVIGFIPEHFDHKVIHSNISELHIVKSMQERKLLMAQYADGFIALPGGLGTLEEIFELINAAKLKLHSKPLFLLDIKNYFSKLIEFIDHMVHEGFLTSEQQALINVIPNHKIILEQFKNLP